MIAKSLRLCYLVCWFLGLHRPIAIAELPMCNICLPLFPSNPIKSIGDVDIKDIGGHGLAAQITISPDSHLMIKAAV